MSESNYINLFKKEFVIGVVEGKFDKISQASARILESVSPMQRPIYSNYDDNSSGVKKRYYYKADNRKGSSVY